MQPRIVTEYRARVTLPNLSTSITGETLHAVKEAVSRIVPGATYQTLTENCTGFYQGDNLVGWINGHDVPETHTVKAITNARLKMGGTVAA